MFSTLHIAEKTTGSRGSLALLRWALVVIFLWFGCMKFTSYEAMGIAPLMKNSPIMSWIPAVFGVQGGSYFIGTVELATAAALIIGAFNKCLRSRRGDVMPDLCRDTDVFPEHAWRRRADRWRVPGDFGRNRTVPVEGPGASCGISVPSTCVHTDSRRVTANR